MTSGTAQREHTRKQWLIFWSVVTTFCSLMPTAYAALVSNSTILFADLLRCLGEFFAILVSWLVLRQTAAHKRAEYHYGFGKLEQLASVAVAGALFFSFLIALSAAVRRLVMPEPLHGTMFGLVFGVLSVLGNAFFWYRNYRFYLQAPSPLMDAQWRLWRAKCFATTVVTVSLAISTALPETPFGVYTDPVGSLVLSGFLLYSAYAMISTSVPDLVDRAVEERVQLIIMESLIKFESKYVGLEKIRTRRSGARIFVDIFLSFQPADSWEQVYRSVMEIKADVESKLTGAEVIIVPGA